MSVKITPTEANSYMVNNIEVYQNSENNWLSRRELTTEEHSAFLNYINPITDEKKNDSTKKPFDLEHLKTALSIIQEKIAAVVRQKEIIDSRKDTFSEECLRLRNYYHKKLNEYEAKKQAIINQLPVSYKTVS
jgi:hypothetical protein